MADDPCTVVHSTPDAFGDCPELPDISVGSFLVANDPTSECPSSLTGNGIPVQSVDGVANRDGSALDPITLPALQIELSTAMIPFLVGTNNSDQLLRLEAHEGITKKVLTSSDGTFQLEDPICCSCFPDDQICECEADWIAGWQITEDDGEGNQTLCLIKIPLDFFTPQAANVWNDTATVDIQGAGSLVSPYEAHVIRSPDAFNAIELRANGVYAPALRISAQPGNILQMLSDGLFAPCCYGDDEIEEL